LLATTRLVHTTEPVLNAVLGAPFPGGSGCGRQTVRITPRGAVIPCVYWGRSDVALADLARLGAEGVLATPEFVRARQVPEACRSCPFVAQCQGGCAGRRKLAGGLAEPDPYCPLVRGQRMDLQWTPGARRDLLKVGSACTTVLAPI